MNCLAGYRVDHRFGKFLSCGKLYLHNSCVCRRAKCFSCSKMEHIQLVCKTIVHFATSTTKLCYSDRNNLCGANSHVVSLFKSSLYIQNGLCLSSGAYQNFLLTHVASNLSLLSKS